MKNKWKLRTPDGVMMSGKSDWLLEGLHAPGFVIGSFENTPGSMVTIPDEAPEDGDNLSDLPMLYHLPDESTPRQQHEQNVQRAVAHLKKHGGKIVISRVIKSAPVSNKDLVFDRLNQFYPDASVFAFTTGPTGTWIGASPELLIEASGGILRSMSLAGTRPAGTEDEWDEKNIHEQQIVTDYIVNTFSAHGLDPGTSEVETVTAGNIEHQMTRIEARLPENWNLDSLTQLLSALSPTPALGGFPRNDALQLIAKLEEHQRGYYGGFFGYIKDAENFRFNVNLRSALLTPDATIIYVGGGITAASIPEDEWEETSRKANTVTVALV